MKNLLYFLLVVIASMLGCVTLEAQMTTRPGMNFAVQSSVGSGPKFTVLGITSDELSKYNATDVVVGDKVYVLDGSECYELTVDSILTAAGAILEARLHDSTGVLSTVTTGQGAIVSPYTTRNVPFIPSGLRSDLASCILQKIASTVNSVTGPGIDSTFVRGDSVFLATGDDEFFTGVASSANEGLKNYNLRWGYNKSQVDREHNWSEWIKIVNDYSLIREPIIFPADTLEVYISGNGLSLNSSNYFNLVGVSKYASFIYVYSDMTANTKRFLYANGSDVNVSNISFVGPKSTLVRETYYNITMKPAGNANQVKVNNPVRYSFWQRVIPGISLSYATNTGLSAHVVVSSADSTSGVITFTTNLLGGISSDYTNALNCIGIAYQGNIPIDTLNQYKGTFFVGSGDVVSTCFELISNANTFTNVNVEGFGYAYIATNDTQLEMHNSNVQGDIHGITFYAGSNNYYNAFLRFHNSVLEKSGLVLNGNTTNNANIIYGSGAYLHPNIVVDMDASIVRNNNAGAWRQFSDGDEKKSLVSWVSKYVNSEFSNNVEYSLLTSNTHRTIMDGCIFKGVGNLYIQNNFAASNCVFDSVLVQMYAYTNALPKPLTDTSRFTVSITNSTFRGASGFDSGWPSNYLSKTVVILDNIRFDSYTAGGGIGNFAIRCMDSLTMFLNNIVVNPTTYAIGTINNGFLRLGNYSNTIVNNLVYTRRVRTIFVNNNEGSVINKLHLSNSVIKARQPFSSIGFVLPRNIYVSNTSFSDWTGQSLFGQVDELVKGSAFPNSVIGKDITINTGANEIITNIDTIRLITIMADSTGEAINARYTGCIKIKTLRDVVILGVNDDSTSYTEGANRTYPAGSVIEMCNTHELIHPSVTVISVSDTIGTGNGTSTSFNKIGFNSRRVLLSTVPEIKLDAATVASVMLTNGEYNTTNLSFGFKEMLSDGARTTFKVAPLAGVKVISQYSYVPSSYRGMWVLK